MAGFNPAKDEGNGDFTGKLRTVSVLATNPTTIAPGDLVTIAGSANTDGIGNVVIASANVAFTGVVASIDPQISGENLSSTGLAASTAGTLKISVDNNIDYIADVANGPMLVADVGFNAPSVVTAATTTGGLMVSNMTVNKTGIATTSTLPWRIVQLLTDQNGENLGSRVLVRPNATTTKPGATGV